MTMSPAQESLAELLRRAELTSKARYHAGRRLDAHSAFSQWTLAFLAVGQVVISLVVALKLKSNFSESYVNFGGVFFGVLVLAYSLLLGMANYSSRSVKLHECGIELGGLARRLFLLCRDPASTSAVYENAAAEYYSILSKYENHTAVDYLVAHHEQSDGVASKLPFLSQDWFLQRIRIFFVRVKLYALHVLQFLHYICSVGLMWLWVYFLVVPKNG